MIDFSLFNLIGLAFATIGAVIALLPNLNSTKNIEDERIISMNKKSGDYSQRKHIRSRNLNALAFSFIGVGFFLQFLSALLP